MRSSFFVLTSSLTNFFRLLDIDISLCLPKGGLNRKQKVGFKKQEQMKKPHTFLMCEPKTFWLKMPPSRLGFSASAKFGFKASRCNKEALTAIEMVAGTVNTPGFHNFSSIQTRNSESLNIKLTALQTGLGPLQLYKKLVYSLRPKN